MKYNLSFLLTIFCFLLSHAQASMTKEIIARNKVKTITEKEFNNNSNESCNTTITTYDKKGNIIKLNWKRIGSFFEYEYDKNGREIATTLTSKSDSTDVQIKKKTYDEYGNITSDSFNKFENVYDDKNRLKKLVILDDKGVSTDTFKVYTYHIIDQVTKEVHYKNNNIVNTILYEYDSFCRLVERREYDKDHIKFWNSEYAEYKNPITYFLTNISYDEEGRIKERYDYYSDPCKSIDDHYLFKNFYTSNDLLEKTEMFFRGRRISTTRYTYTYY